MFKKLRKALVTSFVGAIALGWLFAQGVLHFAYVFISPLTSWLARREYGAITDRAPISAAFSLQDALPELARSASLLLLGYVLLRWLYFKPLELETAQQESEQRS